MIEPLLSTNERTSFAQLYIKMSCVAFLIRTDPTLKPIYHAFHSGLIQHTKYCFYADKMKYSVQFKTSYN